MNTSFSTTVYLDDIKADIILPQSFSEFIKAINSIWMIEFPKNYELIYIDKENDIVNIFDEEDYSVALVNIGSNSKFFIEKYKENKKHIEVGKNDTAKIKNGKIYTINDLYRCPRCNGTMLDKKRNICKKCYGTGKMLSDTAERLTKIIDTELTAIMSKEVPQLVNVQELLKTSNPIIKTELHPESTSIICPTTTENHQEIINMEKHKKENKQEDSKEKISNFTKKPFLVENDTQLYKGELAKPIKQIITTPDSEIKIELNIKNTGKLPWPKETVLVPEIPLAKSMITEGIGSVNPGDTFTKEIYIKAPSELGKHKVSYSLMDGKKKAFEDKIIFKIKVIKKANKKASICRQHFADRNIALDETKEKNLVYLINKYKTYEPEILLEILLQMGNDIKLVDQYLCDILQ